MFFRRRWVLKAPTHMFALPTLLATYPDALFLQTHRAPLAAVTSVSRIARRSSIVRALQETRFLATVKRGWVTARAWLNRELRA